MNPLPPTHARLLVAASDAARMLGVSTRTLWRWAASGRVPPPVRIGGCARWRVADLDAWVAALRPSAAGAASDANTTQP